MSTKPTARQVVGEVPLIVGMLMTFVGAPAIGVLACVRWLQHRAWPNWTPVGFGYVPPVTHWLAVNAIIDYFYLVHVGWLVMLAGVVSMWSGVWILNDD